MRKTFNLEINGYYLNAVDLHSRSGIYLVYRCVHNSSASTVSLKELLYVGESADVSTRVLNHERRLDWLRQVGPGEMLCFSTIEVPGVDRLRVEASLIYKHKPKLNSEYKNDFPFDETALVLNGACALLNTNFTASRFRVTALY